MTTLTWSGRPVLCNSTVLIRLLYWSLTSDTILLESSAKAPTTEPVYIQYNISRMTTPENMRRMTTPKNFQRMTTPTNIQRMATPETLQRMTTPK